MHPSVKFAFATDGAGVLEASEGDIPGSRFAAEIDVLFAALDRFGSRNFGSARAMTLDFENSLLIAGKRVDAGGVIGVVAADRAGLGILLHHVSIACRPSDSKGERDVG